MITINSKRKRANFVLTSTATLLFLICLPLTSAAESWQLQTAIEEVPGTRDIEAGRLDKGIRILEWYLRAASFRQRGAVLTNLCMAYTLNREYETATAYCDQAVARDQLPKVAHNNRGVLRALQGDFAGALSDFRKAGCFGDCPADLMAPGSLPMMVARQNLSRAEEQYAAIQRKFEDVRISRKEDE